MGKQNIFEGRKQIFTISQPRSSISIVEILKNMSKLEQWTNRNQVFRQLTNKKQRGPQRNLVDISDMVSPKLHGKCQ